LIIRQLPEHLNRKMLVSPKLLLIALASLALGNLYPLGAPIFFNSPLPNIVFAGVVNEDLQVKQRIENIKSQVIYH
jgi:hypothetical protein